MDETTVLSHLEALAETLEIQIRYESMEGEDLFPQGGLCKINGKQLIIVNTKASVGQKVRTLARALCRFDLSEIYLKPAIRDYLVDTKDA